MREIGRLPDPPKEVTEAFESLKQHLAGIAHIRALTTFGPPSFARYRLSVIGDPDIQWDLIPTTWHGYDVEHLDAGDSPRPQEQ